MGFCRTALVTGGLGFIGKNFVRDVSDRYENIIIIDKFSYASDIDFYKKYNSSSALVLQRVAELKLEPYVALYGTIDIYNFAAESHVDRSFENGPTFVESNVLDACHLLEEVKKFRDSVRLIHISTDEVYGECNHIAAEEGDLFNPTNPYSASKAAADLLVQTYKKCFLINAITIRANNVFGEGQYFEKLIPKAIYRAANSLKFELHGDGKMQRHFLHTSDFSLALINLVSIWDELDEDIFNIAGDDELTIHEVVSLVYGNFDLDPQNFLVFKGDRPFNDKRYLVSDIRIRATGWEPKANFELELKQLCATHAYFK